MEKENTFTASHVTHSWLFYDRDTLVPSRTLSPCLSPLTLRGRLRLHVSYWLGQPAACPGESRLSISETWWRKGPQTKKCCLWTRDLILRKKLIKRGNDTIESKLKANNCNGGQLFRPCWVSLIDQHGVASYKVALRSFASSCFTRNICLDLWKRG